MDEKRIDAIVARLCSAVGWVGANATVDMTDREKREIREEYLERDDEL